MYAFQVEVGLGSSAWGKGSSGTRSPSRLTGLRCTAPYLKVFDEASKSISTLKKTIGIQVCIFKFCKYDLHCAGLVMD